ncbi:MAG: PKD domain-containing protein, partial [Bacteroidota bacterium]
WQRSFPCARGGYFSDVVEASSGEILVCGNKKMLGKGRQFWWMVLSADGDSLHESVMGGTHDEYLVSASAIEGGGFFLGGYSIYTHSGKYAKGAEDFWLIRVNVTGKVLWKNTYGGPNNERCFDVLSYRPGVFFALGEKANDFAEQESSRGKDFWLLRVEEYPCSAIDARIMMQARNFQVKYGDRLRFKARYRYADRFFWEFGDGTTSNLEKPLKTYSLPGLYQVGLTIYTNESCKQTTKLSRPLEVE